MHLPRHHSLPLFPSTPPSSSPTDRRVSPFVPRESLDLVFSSLAPSFLLLLLLFHPLSRFARAGNPSRRRALQTCHRLLTDAPPSAPCSFISHYRNPSVYPFSHPRSGLASGRPSLRRIAYYPLLPREGFHSARGGIRLHLDVLMSS